MPEWPPLQNQLENKYYDDSSGDMVIDYYNDSNDHQIHTVVESTLIKIVEYLRDLANKADSMKDSGKYTHRFCFQLRYETTLLLIFNTNIMNKYHATIRCIWKQMGQVFFVTLRKWVCLEPVLASVQILMVRELTI